MKSNVVNILNMDEGHEKAIREVKKVSDYEGLGHKESLQLQLLAEEMLGLLKSVAGDVKSNFWIEAGQGSFCLYLSTKTNMDMQKREQFLSSSSTGKNEEANSFIGYLRDMLDVTMYSQPYHSEELPDDVLADITNRVIRCSDEEWDRYEQSTLKKLADTIKIGIRGENVVITVIKTFK